MGLIRKTASIATFGAVNFRSKKERLDRLNAEHSKLGRRLEKVESDRSGLREAVETARKRAEKAELETLATAKRARRRARRKAMAREATSSAGNLSRRARRTSRKASRRAAKAAKNAASTVTDPIEELTG